MISQVYIDQVNSWHARRIATLKNDFGWLTVVGLEWLTEGINDFPNLGTVTLHRGKVNVQLSAGLLGTIGEQAFVSGSIKTEVDSEGPDRVKVGMRAFVIIKRGDRFALRIWDTEAIERVRLTGIARYPISERWRIEASWEKYRKLKAVKLQTVIHGYAEEYKVPGIAVFNVGGSVCRLEPIVEEGSDELFYVFSDGTSGRESHGDGRYIYASPAEKGIVVLDFNKAINPPSAFTPHATSPLPPDSNRLKVKIEAGEKAYFAV